MIREINIAIIGAGDLKGTGVLRGVDNPSKEIEKLAYETGRMIAIEGWNLVCGGLGGVMEAAARGAAENGGTTIGILPGERHDEANRYIKIVIPTGLGHARNAVIATSAEAMIAVGGGHGTLSDIALGLKLGKPVVELVVPGRPKRVIDSLMHAETSAEAIQKIKTSLGMG